MAALSRQASDVRITEIDLSTTLVQNSNITAAIAVVSKKGPIGPTLYTSFDQFRTDFGDPNSAVSFDHYCVADFFKEGNQLWARRAVPSDSMFGGAIAYVTSVGDTALSTLTLHDPTTFSAWVANTPSNAIPLYMFYYYKGPGSDSANIAIKIRSQNLKPPTGVSTASASTGGSLTAGTYQYTVSAFGPNGETLGSTPTSIVVSSITNTNVVNVTWTSVDGATGYYVYGRLTTGTPGRVATVGATTAIWTDDGLTTPDSTHNPITNPNNLPAPSPLFNLEVYDLTFDTQNPVETFPCSMTEQTDELGLQMETTQRVNSFSRYIRVVSHIPALLSLPYVYSVGNPTAFAAGTSGSAPTDADINAAWDVFLDKQRYVIDVAINSGKTSIAVQKHMDYMVAKRFDAVAFLDVPSNLQDFQAAVDFRNLTLNLNSSFSALFCSDLLELDPISGKKLFIPPSGAMAALMARTTRVAQPWFSMAGLNRGLLDVLDVRNTYDDGAATYLYQNQVNYMRKFVGSGIPLWEQSTLYTKASALQFLNVRVLCNVLKRSMYNFLIYSLQEPGDDILRRQIKYGLEDYLSYVQGARGIKGFQVVCAAVNNPGILTNSGITAVAVYIVPTLATRQINLSLLIGKDGLQVSEQDIAAAAV